MEIKLQNSKKINHCGDVIDCNFKEAFLSNFFFQVKSVPVPGESEAGMATETTDVEGRLSALLQETKELKVGFGEIFICCMLYEMNSRKFDVSHLISQILRFMKKANGV